MQSNNTLEDFHLVGNTTSRTSVGPSATSYRGTPPGESNAQDKETITVDADETIEDSRTEKRLNWTKDEDIRLASAWVHNSKDPVDGTDRKSEAYILGGCYGRIQQNHRGLPQEKSEPTENLLGSC